MGVPSLPRTLPSICMSFCGSLPIANAFIKHTQDSQIKTSNNFFLKQGFIGNGLNPQAFAK